MSNLQEYLSQKRERYYANLEDFKKNPEKAKKTISANVQAKGRSGVREIRIRNYQIISDSPEDYAGYSLGPSSPELLLGVLGSCLTHISLIEAAKLNISLQSLHVDVFANINALAGEAGHEDIPIYPHNIRYELHVESEEPKERIKELHDEIEKNCPLYNLLKSEQTITGSIHQHESQRGIG